MIQKTIALVAHDNKKKALLHCVKDNYQKLKNHKLICTGTTGSLVEKAIDTHHTKDDIKPLVQKLKSGPLGGDQQLGAMISEGLIDMVIFLWDPMEPQPHDVDIKALLRLAVLYNIPTACSRSTADYILSSPLLESDYKPEAADYSNYLSRKVNA